MSVCGMKAMPLSASASSLLKRNTLLLRPSVLFRLIRLKSEKTNSKLRIFKICTLMV